MDFKEEVKLGDRIIYSIYDKGINGYTGENKEFTASESFIDFIKNKCSDEEIIHHKFKIKIP